MTGPPRDTGCEGCTVLDFCVLSGLDEEGLPKIERAIQRIPCATDETIFHQGAPVLGYHILCQGLAKHYARSSRGRRVLFKFSGPGDLLGGAVAEVHQATVQAIEDSLVAFIDRQVFSELLRNHPRVSLEVTRRIGEDRDLLAQRLLAMASGDVRHRLARVLMELGERHGVKGEEGILIDLPLSRQDLADLVGASRQTVSQELHRMVRRRLIQLTRHTIILTDVAGLERLR